MPGFNQMGPENKGPMTGRGMGRCANNDTPENTDPEFRGGRRCRRGGAGGSGVGRGRLGNGPGRGRR